MRAQRSALVGVGLAISSAACAGRPPPSLASDVEVLKVEQSPENLLARGRAAAEMGELFRAEQYLAAAMGAGVPPNEVLPQLIRVCAADKRYRTAIGYAEPVLSRHPADHRLRFVVGSLYATIGEAGVAREHFETILRQAPDSPDVHFALGVLLRDVEGDPAGADVHFREYLHLRPSGSHAEEARSSLSAPSP